MGTNKRARKYGTNGRTEQVFGMATGAAPKERIQARQELRRSNAAGKHQDKRDKRARTRGAAKQRALRDWR